MPEESFQEVLARFSRRAALLGAGASLWNRLGANTAQFAVATAGQQSRRENCVSLYERA